MPMSTWHMPQSDTAGPQIVLHALQGGMGQRAPFLIEVCPSCLLPTWSAPKQGHEG